MRDFRARGGGFGEEVFVPVHDCWVVLGPRSGGGLVVVVGYAVQFVFGKEVEGEEGFGEGWVRGAGGEGD